MFVLSQKIEFPPIENTSQEGILAIGGDLSPSRLKLAYSKGIFPWFENDDLIVWWCPDPRMVLFPHELKISKSMRSLINKERFKVTFNTNFNAVIEQCAIANRPNQEGTWITEGMIESYQQLHKEGWAKSVEVWDKDELVGGLYGIDLGSVFCGESMFSKVSDASKYGFIAFVQELQVKNYKLIDCQIHTNHLESLGAREVPREVFLSHLP